MEENSKFLAFPEKFKFGTSVAAFQVEGNTSKERKTDWDVLISQNANQIIRPGEVSVYSKEGLAALNTLTCGHKIYH